MKAFLGAAALAMASLFASSSASAGDAIVDTMGETFVAGLPDDIGVERGAWEFLDVLDCYLNGDSCFGNNPSSPYGYTRFRGLVSMKLGVSEAVVIFMRTPPPSRYFGFTQYLVRRGRSPRQVLASLSDSLNQLNFSTLQSNAPGDQVFNQYAVLVWTADLNTLARVKTQLAAQGIPEAKVNFMPMPIGLPLNMGYGPDDDSFSILMRMAMPVVQAELDQYRLDSPFFAVKVSPRTPPPVSPAPIIGYRSELSGISEVATYGAALDSLVRDIKARYARSYALRTQNVSYISALGFECIAGTAICTLDTHDGLYANDLSQLSYKVTNLKDIVLIAGVNHQRTGKALYVNHTVNDVAKQTGIISVDDPALTTGSALYHAGVTSPDDPRVQRYEKLYAYAVSYDCSGLQYCMQIPAPTPENPIGLLPGSPFGLYERSYVDPMTGVRPSQQEIVKHQVLIGRKK
ncbi:MAG TPA: hypothetical protein PLF63_01055 [Rubrivivax sp.]|jgi:hypothetical protein|nr:hypothetical protein [Rubrivivax sp.]